MLPARANCSAGSSVSGGVPYARGEVALRLPRSLFAFEWFEALLLGRLLLAALLARGEGFLEVVALPACSNSKGEEPPASCEGVDLLGPDADVARGARGGRVVFGDNRDGCPSPVGESLDAMSRDRSRVGGMGDS